LNAGAQNEANLVGSNPLLDDQDVHRVVVAEASDCTKSVIPFHVCFEPSVPGVLLGIKEGVGVAHTNRVS